MSTLNDADRAARDAALRAMVPLVPRMGWSRAAIAAGLAGAGLPAEEAGILFPRGPASAVDAWLDQADREMAAAAGDLTGLRTPGRIRALVEARLRLAAPHKEALRRAMALLALPWNAALAVRTGARTANAIWHAAGDRSSDVSWYTRRMSLAAIYGATLAFWLRDDAEDPGPALAFLERRMAGLARLGRCRKRLSGAAAA